MGTGGLVRRLALTAVASLIVALAPATAAQADAGVLRIQGGGWGHGVGMSQYGAYGMALEGATAEQIVTHYYTGTQIATLDQLPLSNDILSTVEDPLWVGLEQNQSSITFKAIGGPLDLCQANDGEGPCPRSEHPQPGETWTFARTGGGCRFYRNGAATGAQVGTCRASISWADGTHVWLDGKEYAYGTIKIRTTGVAGGNFHVSLAIDLEHYLRGIAEMPASWPLEALKAQAIAARTYAVYRFLGYEIPSIRTESDAGLSSSRKSSCWCHLKDTSADQVYLGWAAEAAPVKANWVAAVDATAGQVVSYQGPDWPDFTKSQVAGAFYFSSSAGATESNIDGFGSSTQYPYLVSVDDHWSADPALNPNAVWQKDVDTAVIAADLGWDSMNTAALVNPAPSATVQFSGTSRGSSVTATKGSAWLRANLSLPSPHVTGLEGDPVGPITNPPVDVEPVVNPFTDLDNNPHLDDVLQIWQAGITQGCAEDRYCPDDPVPRWQMALFLTRLHTAGGYDLMDGSDQGFEDIESLEPAYRLAINQLRQIGVTKGTSDTTYTPNINVPRWQMALFIARLLAVDGITLPDGSDQGFTDIGDLSDEAQLAINQLRQLGVITLSGQYEPYRDMSRDLMAQFMAGSLDAIQAHQGG
jgi:SpoIID/LytB domain protein